MEDRCSICLDAYSTGWAIERAKEHCRIAAHLMPCRNGVHALQVLGILIAEDNTVSDV